MKWECNNSCGKIAETKMKLRERGNSSDWAKRIRLSEAARRVSGAASFSVVAKLATGAANFLVDAAGYADDFAGEVLGV